MANTPGKHRGPSIRPVGGAGRVQAQSPNPQGDSKKQGTLLRSLEADKENAVKSVRVVTVAASPYRVDEATDEILLVSALNGAVTIDLGDAGALDTQKLLRVWKIDSTESNVVLTTAAASPFHINGVDVTDLHLSRPGASVTVFRPGEAGGTFAGWLVVSDPLLSLWLPQSVSAASVDVDTVSSFYFVDTASNNVTLNLPSISDSLGRRIVFKKVAAANTMTIDGDGTDEIDGALTQAVAGLYDLIEIVGTGGSWSLLHIGAP
jgi:hypothetical protein